MVVEGLVSYEIQRGERSCSTLELQEAMISTPDSISPAAPFSKKEVERNRISDLATPLGNQRHLPFRRSISLVFFLGRLLMEGLFHAPPP